MSDHNFEQQCAIRSCFRLVHGATETFQKLRQAYGDSVSRTTRLFVPVRTLLLQRMLLFYLIRF